MIHGTSEDVIGALASTVSVPDWRLASVLDGAADAILVCSDDGQVVYFNQACERLFGYGADQIVGCHVEALLPRHDGSALGEGHWTSRFHPAAGDGRVRLRSLDGREFAAEVTISAATTATGPYSLLIIREKMAQSGRNADAGAGGDGAATDAQAEIVRTARIAAMEELGGALAHKLNQPLTAVILYLQAIGRAYGRETDGNILPEKVVAILEKAVREAERASSFLQRIRQAHEQEMMGQQPVDLNRALEDVLDLGVFVDRRGARIERLLTPRLPPVRGNPVELQQALIALIRAALETAGRAGAPGIRLATQRLGEHVMVVAELRPAAAQGGAPLGAPPGVPLGEIAINCAESTDGRRNCEKDLSIARAIAHGHGGELMVDCDGRDRGTKFTLRLPLQAEAASSL